MTHSADQCVGTIVGSRRCCQSRLSSPYPHLDAMEAYNARAIQSLLKEDGFFNVETTVKSVLCEAFAP